MTANELRELADRLNSGSWQSDADVAADYLRACADALDAGPVAWTLKDTLDKRESTTHGRLWFTDPQSAAWVPLYLAALPGALRMPEPMTDSDIAFLLGHTGPEDERRWKELHVARAIENEVLLRVKEANE